MPRNSLIAMALFTASCASADKGFVVYNNPPAVTISDPVEGQVFDGGEPVFFTGAVVDDGDVAGLNVEWVSSLDGVLPDADPPSPDGLVEFVSTALTSGTHVITLRATDPGNEQGEAQVTIEVGELVLPDNEPVVEVISPAPGVEGIQDVPFTFAANASDAIDPPSALVVELQSSISGFVCFMVPDSSGNALCEESLPIGTHLLSFTVVDSEGYESTANAVFDVVDPADADQDGDGWTPNGGDCNDSAATVYPGAPEICYDGFDNDCPAAGTEPDGPGSTCYDDDGDGYCEIPPCSNAPEVVPDCDDTFPTVNPGAVEVQNGIDDDCDGLIDEGTPVYDDDGDGFCESPPCINAPGGEVDCDDSTGAVRPGADEVCSDGVDTNCNGIENEQNAIGCQFFFADNDGDGYGNQSGQSACYCDNTTTPYTAVTAADCDDTSSAVNPGQTQYFTSPTPMGNWDYNCDGVGSQQYPGGATCIDGGFFSCDGGAGWVGSIPQCGASGSYQGDCEMDWDEICLLFCGVCLLDPSGGACQSCAGTSCGASPYTCVTDSASRLQGCR